MKITRKIHDLQSLNFLSNSNLKIGVLGGSFDPAHCGHLTISQRALQYYGFDYVIWLVARQNPFKKSYQSSMQKRSEDALDLVKGSRIIITTVEEQIKSKYTYQSMSYLINRFKNCQFSWLMGIDNLDHFHKWQHSERLTKLCQFIVFDRPVERRMANNRRFLLKNKGIVANSQSDNIIVDRCRLNNQSSTLLRRSIKLS